MGLVAINCVTVFLRRATWVSTSCTPTSDIASSREGYIHVSSRFRCNIRPVILFTTLWWYPPSVLLMRGDITHASELYRSTACTTTILNIPNFRAYDPSRPSTRDNRSHFCLALHRFRITAGQSSSDADRTRPRYLNDETDVRGRSDLPTAAEVSGGVPAVQIPL